MNFSLFKLRDVSIRTKIILGQFFLIVLVSVFIYSYYPKQQKELALQAVEGKIESISNMFSIGVGIGMGEMDLVAVSEALEWAHSDSSVIYISILNTDSLEIASFNPDNVQVPKELTLSEGLLEVNGIIFKESKILYQGIIFGNLFIGYSLNRIDQEIAKLKKTTLYFCLALLTVGGVLSVIIGNMITSNIRNLDNAVKAISSGLKNTRVKVKSNDEMGKLGAAFNNMLDNLERSRDELLAYSEQLKKQNKELNQFSYVVSHDLKAPLRAIFKLSEWIEEDLGDSIPEDSRKNLETLRGRVFRLESLINGLLEYSKIGRTDISPENVDTNKLINDIIELLNPPEYIQINIQEKMPVVHTKRILLQQVFSNLINNAIKYHDKKERGVINIKAKEIGRFYTFVVEDNGPGIEKQYHEKIFAIFQTLETRDRVEGTGIGLSIVKKIIEEVGGAIKVESEPGTGSKFIFTWPKEIVPASKLKIA
ncbi:PAS/PAC Sensor Signal Transduction Histidine Kinase [Fulvivirga imtechensis AK7]|uniref:histidine kinase n=1 Tax=Fulvivirga imtechensis AK7 TaxID=1237149 RepID=L8JZH8_9BACT|nr:ATP-binding protein [Fulvivirga imtechensis]ELR73069.1 PAS/PAC Sensor Signal Transduction Histidine Kinase [Fulvivirga imtechensis AK7]